MVLSTLVVIVQVMVFCLLTSIYISLATEHEEHEARARTSHGARRRATRAGARALNGPATLSDKTD